MMVIPPLPAMAGVAGGACCWSGSRSRRNIVDAAAKAIAASAEVGGAAEGLVADERAVSDDHEHAGARLAIPPPAPAVGWFSAWSACCSSPPIAWLPMSVLFMTVSLSPRDSGYRRQCPG